VLQYCNRTITTFKKIYVTSSLITIKKSSVTIIIAHDMLMKCYEIDFSLVNLKVASTPFSTNLIVGNLLFLFKIRMSQNQANEKAAVTIFHNTNKVK